MALFVSKFLPSLFYSYPNIIAGKRGGGYGGWETCIRSCRNYPSDACIAAYQGRGINLIAVPPRVFRQVRYIRTFPPKLSGRGIIIASGRGAGTVGYKMISEVFTICGSAPSLPAETNVAGRAEECVSRFQLITWILAGIFY